MLWIQLVYYDQAYIAWFTRGRCWGHMYLCITIKLRCRRCLSEDSELVNIYRWIYFSKLSSSPIFKLQLRWTEINLVPSKTLSKSRYWFKATVPAVWRRSKMHSWSTTNFWKNILMRSCWWIAAMVLLFFSYLQVSGNNLLSRPSGR